MMQFHGYFRSSSAHRCRVAFNLKGIPVESSFIHLRKGGGEQKQAAYKAINPQGLVPSLVANGETLTQSLAIIEWLDETHPLPPLLPKDPLQRAKVRAFAMAIACDIHPLQNLRVLDYLRSELGHGQDVLDAWCRRWITEGLLACEALLQNNSGSDYCFGDTPTFADICLVPQIFSAKRFNVDLSVMPTLTRIFDNCMARKEFIDAAPAAQPDAEA